MALQILVVEDDRRSLELMVEVLGSLDVQIEAVSDSAKASQAIDERKFDGIFLDLTMPGLDGLALTAQARRSEPNRTTPVVVVDASPEQSSMDAAFRSGADFYFPKPLDRSKLLELVRTTTSAMLYHQFRYTRMPLRTKVHCRGAVGKSALGETYNLSQNGLLFEAGNVFSVGDMAHVTFALPGDSVPIKCLCVVARVDDQGRAGVRFTGISGSDRFRIQDVVTRFGAA
jgi:CheY-like chemotaxis protein